VLWNKENLAAYLTKGAKLYVEGRIQTRSYEDNGGVKRSVTEVVAQNIVLLLGGNGNGDGSGTAREGKSGGHTMHGKARQRPLRPRPPIPKSKVFKTNDIPF